jgi:hypothetical protein
MRFAPFLYERKTMAADFKSHVLLRDEKGFFGIPFKRLLLGGVGGGLTYTLCNIVMPAWAIPAGVVLAIFVLVMTGTRGGLPLWQRLLYRVRGSLLLAAEVAGTAGGTGETGRGGGVRTRAAELRHRHARVGHVCPRCRSGSG